jgi:hypothetical protein
VKCFNDCRHNTPGSTKGVNFKSMQRRRDIMLDEQTDQGVQVLSEHASTDTANH